MVDSIGNSLSMTQSLADRANGSNTLSQETIDAIAAANAANGTSTSKSATSQLSANFDTFIKMLTTQLQNQDPLEPTDTSQFTQQLVMYSQVEQQLGTNTKLDNILTALSANNANTYMDYIGRTVAAQSDSLVLTGGTSTVSYTLPDNAASVKVQVLDANNNVVVTLNGDPKLGDHNVTWDGKMADGSQMTDGKYKFKIVALKEDGTAMADIKQFAVAKVTAIKATSSGTVLELNGNLQVDPTKILAIGA